MVDTDSIKPKWEFGKNIPRAFRQKNNKGAKVIGWTDVNLGAVALALSMSPEHVRETVSGRTNATIGTLEKIAACLKMSIEQLVARREYAKQIRAIEEKNS